MLEQLRESVQELTLTVSELNEYVRRTLAADPILQGLRIRAEVSNFKRHSSGHLYFTLRDEQSRVACVMFRQNAQTMALRPEDGVRVIARGYAALFSRDGAYQFYVESMKLDGVGALYLRYERLRRKLMEEGLFDASRKKPLPLLPRGVGIVTSETGAVIRDICNVARRRHPGVPLFLYPANVQGDGAAEDLARGIKYFDRYDNVDVIIIGRGGGSLEDLWAFNEEIVARAVYDCRKPVISAVGHETDTALSDFAADVRAPTPSAAAELAIPEADALSDSIAEMAERLARAVRMAITSERMRLRVLAHRLSLRSMDRVIAANRVDVARLIAALDAATARWVQQRRDRVQGLLDRLKALDPTAVLARGYAIVTGPDGRCVADAARISVGQGIAVRLRDGSLKAAVDDIVMSGET